MTEGRSERESDVGGEERYKVEKGLKKKDD